MLRKIFITVVLCVLLIEGFSALASACSSIFINRFPGYMITARNLDYFGPCNPSMVITPRGIQHNGGDSAGAARWTTKYGSVVIYAENVFPCDGMNEKGLAGHTQFYTDGSQVQQDNLDKPVLESRAWLSYILDNFSTVNEAVLAIKNMRLMAVELPVFYPTNAKHIAIEDSSGDAAIIELDNGKVNIYHDRSCVVMTNPPSYPEQLANAAKYKNIKDISEVPSEIVDSSARFSRATCLLNAMPQPDNKYQAQGFAMSVLYGLACPVSTLRNGEAEKEIIDVYGKFDTHPKDRKGGATYIMTLSDLSHGEFHFKSLFAASEVWVNLRELDFSAGQPVRSKSGFHNYAQDGLEGNITAAAKKW